MSIRMLLTMITAATAVASAQTPSTPIDFPSFAGQVQVRHWKEQFVQWIGPELPYSMIELYVSDLDGKPAYEAVLTDRTGSNHIHYCSDQRILDFEKKRDLEAYLTPIQVTRPKAVALGATYLIQFRQHDGQVVSWQFVQGSDISERGSGTSPAESKGLALLSRQQGAVAGEGSAVQIGNKVSTADVWKEISQPPYFTAYHGAVSENVDLVEFDDSKQDMAVVSGPSTLEPGGNWLLRTPDGDSIKAAISSAKGMLVEATLEPETLGGRSVVIQMERKGQDWSVLRIQYLAPKNRGEGELNLTFNPPIESSTNQSRFELKAGSTKIADGEVQTLGTAPYRVKWQFRNPSWLVRGEHR